MNGDQCSIDGCDNPAHSRSPMCSKHRARVTRHGDPHFVTVKVKAAE